MFAKQQNLQATSKAEHIREDIEGGGGVRKMMDDAKYQNLEASSRQDIFGKPLKGGKGIRKNIDGWMHGDCPKIVDIELSLYQRWYF